MSTATTSSGRGRISKRANHQSGPLPKRSNVLHRAVNNFERLIEKFDIAPTAPIQPEIVARLGRVEDSVNSIKEMLAVALGQNSRISIPQMQPNTPQVEEDEFQIVEQFG